MLIRECIYLIETLISLFSMPILIYSILTNDKNICKQIVRISVIYIIYMIYLFLFLGQFNIYEIPYDFGAIMIWFYMFIATVLYIIAIIISKMKQKKLKQQYPNKNRLTIIVITVIIFFQLFLYGNVLQDKHYINNSDLILIYHSSGNGGIGASDEFAYAIGEDFCEQIDLGINISGHYFKKFLPKSTNAVEITDINDIKNYEIIFKSNRTLVYKGKEYVCEKKHKSDYSNIKFKKGFSINHN